MITSPKNCSAVDARLSTQVIVHAKMKMSRPASFGGTRGLRPLLQRIRQLTLLVSLVAHKPLQLLLAALPGPQAAVAMSVDKKKRQMLGRVDKKEQSQGAVQQAAEMATDGTTTTHLLGLPPQHQDQMQDHDLAAPSALQIPLSGQVTKATAVEADPVKKKDQNKKQVEEKDITSESIPVPTTTARAAGSTSTAPAETDKLPTSAVEKVTMSTRSGSTCTTPSGGCTNKQSCNATCPNGECKIINYESERPAMCAAAAAELVGDGSSKATAGGAVILVAGAAVQ